ncbi:MAG: arylsulfatase [Planctomycetota bacterium]|nr:MAG: arylsulfatase [Planctomycetota bacterium]
MSRFRSLLSLLPLLAVACAAPATDRRPERPNLVVLFADDLGYGDLGCFGHPIIRTPNLDRMAAEGTRFTQFYSASPACTASRYSLLTGRLAARSGFAWVLVPSSPRGLHAAERTLADELREAGYATAAVGKWHLGNRPEFLPLAHGFDEYLGLPYSNDMLPPRWPPIPPLEGDKEVESGPDQSTLTRRYTERALSFIDRNRDRPFFLYLAYAMPHVPLHPGAAFAGRSPRGAYGDAVEEIDWSVGRILDRLRRLGLAERTLVLFTSDNGPWIIKGLDGGSAGLLRDGKGSTWEGGMREPAIFWWPGTVPAGRVERAVASTLDLFPTALELAGRPLPEPGRGRNGAVLDGRSILPLLLGRGAPEDRPFFYHGPGHVLHAVRLGRWKLHLKTSSQTGKEYFEGRVPLLFDLERDPSETRDLAAEEPEVVARLTALAAEHEREVAEHGSFWDRG